MKIKNKLKIEKFFKELFVPLLLALIIILFFSWLFNKPFEALIFTASHFTLRPLFNKQYHAETTHICLLITACVIFFGIYYCTPLNISLLGGFGIAFVVCLAGNILQDKIDFEIKLKPNLRNMEIEQFKIFCRQKGLTENEIYIAKKIIREELKGEDLYVSICYSKRQTIRIRRKIMQKLSK